MRTTAEVVALLDELERVNADSLEDQTLDFKEWDPRGRIQAVGLITETAICLANGGGGMLVVGVHDRNIGRRQAIVGVPQFVDVNLLRRSLYDKTDPHLTPIIEEISVPEGTGRILVIQVHGDLRPYTDVLGAAKIRVGKDCMPMTGSRRAEMLAVGGASDATAADVDGDIEDLVSARGMESLREIAKKQSVAEELIAKTDRDLLSSLELISDAGRLRLAGLLIVGKADQIGRHFPGYSWSFMRMQGDTEYDVPARGSDCLAVALPRLEELIAPYNPVTTVRQGLLDLEFSKYPPVAIREALMNAFAHADYRSSGLIQVRLYEDRLEFRNPGGFIGGVREENILRHTPVARNPTLVNALIRLNLVNRMNLGVGRMYRAMLVDGKEPPVIRDEGGAVRTVFFGSDYSVSFRAFVESTMRDGFRLSIEHLLVLNYLVRHDEIDAKTAAQICQQQERENRETMRQLTSRGVLQLIKRGNANYWRLTPGGARALAENTETKVVPVTPMEAATRQVLEALERNASAGLPGITFSEVRELTGLTKDQTKYLLKKMKRKYQIQSKGKGPLNRWNLPGEA